MAECGIPPHISLLTGPFLLGNLFGYGLYGILVVQIYVYWNNFPKDPLIIKSAVWFVLFVDTVITIFATVGAWVFLASGWGDLKALTPFNWAMIGLPFLSAMVAFILHAFYAWRIWKLLRSLGLPCFICLISLLSWAVASYVGFGSATVGLPRLVEFQRYIVIWLSTSAGADIIITTTMVWILVGAKRSMVFEQSTSRVARLITVTVETGMATSFCALVELVLFVGFPKYNLHFIPFLMLGKLYSNTILATLNSRSSSQNAGRPALWGSHAPSFVSSSGSRTGPHKGSIQISTVVEQRSDVEMYVFEKGNS